MFHCEERGTKYPYFAVTRIVGGKAMGVKTQTPDGTLSGGNAKVRISLYRLIQPHLYRLIEGVMVLHPDSHPRPAVPAQHTTVISATAAPAAGETSTTGRDGPVMFSPEDHRGV